MLSWRLGARLVRRREEKKGVWAKARGGSPGSPGAGSLTLLHPSPPDGWVCCSGAGCWTRPLPRPNRGASVCMAPRVESGAGRETERVMGKADVREPQPLGRRGVGVTGSFCLPNPCLRVSTAGVGREAHRMARGYWREQTGKRWRPGRKSSVAPLSSDTLSSRPTFPPLVPTTRSSAASGPSHLGVPSARGPDPCVPAPDPGPGCCAIGPWPGSDPTRQLPPPQR